MPIRLYDTARRRSCPSRRARSSPCTRAASRPTTPPTSVTPPSTSPTTCCSAACATSATRRSACATSPTSTTHLFAKARELGVTTSTWPPPRTPGSTPTCDALDVFRCFSEPRATSAIPDIRGFIGMVLDRGYAYQAGGAVYFDVAPFARFGADEPLRPRRRCSRWPPSAAATSTTRNKRDPLDFVLWQPSAPDEPSWETLWGPGRPGWHIECSALALRELGTTIDLHGGGTDLIFPHHECEGRSPRRPPASRSCATGCTRRWSAWTARRCRRPRQPRVRRRPAQGVGPAGDPPRRSSSTTTATAWEWDDDAHAAGRRAPRRWLAAPRGRRRAASTRCGPRSTTTSTRPARSPRSTTPSAGRGVAEAAALLGVDLGRGPVSAGGTTTRSTRTPAPRHGPCTDRPGDVGQLGVHSDSIRARQKTAEGRVSPARRLWRLDPKGFERLPPEGPAILSPNHVGSSSWRS